MENNKEQQTDSKQPYKQRVQEYISAIPPIIADTLIAENALEKAPVRAMQFLLRAILAFVVIVILWASFSKIDVVVSAVGKIVPSGKVKTLQAAQAGVVNAIHIRDGQHVNEGDILIELDTTSIGADNKQVSAELMLAQLDVSRLKSVLQQDADLFNPPKQTPEDLLRTQKALLASTISEHKQKMALLDDEISNRKAEVTSASIVLRNLKSSSPMLSEKLKRHESLFSEGFLSQEKLDEVRMTAEQVESELQVQKHKHLQAKTALEKSQREYEWAQTDHQKTTLDALSEATKRRDTLQQDLIKAKQRKGLQTIRAPLSGVVQQLAVTTIGGVVSQADPLMVIVPDNSVLEVEAKLLNKDIGSVSGATDVVVKVDAFDFTRYGGLAGKIDWVATDSVNDKAMGEVFPIRVTIEQSTTPNSVNGKVGTIMPGMSVTADIVIGKRRMIEYFMGPIMRYKDESLRER